MMDFRPVEIDTEALQRFLTHRAKRTVTDLEVTITLRHAGFFQRAGRWWGDSQSLAAMELAKDAFSARAE